MEAKRKKILAIAAVAFVVVAVFGGYLANRYGRGSLLGTATAGDRAVYIGDEVRVPNHNTNASYDGNYLRDNGLVEDGETPFGGGGGFMKLYARSFTALKATGDQPTTISQYVSFGNYDVVTHVTIKEKPRPVDATYTVGQELIIDTGWINGNIATERRFAKTPPQCDPSYIRYDGYTKDTRPRTGPGPSWQFNAHHKFTVLKATDEYGTDISWDWRSIHVLVQ